MTTIKFLSNDNINSSVVLNTKISDSNVMIILSFNEVSGLVKNKNSWISSLTVLVNGELVAAEKEYSIFENETLKKRFKYSPEKRVIMTDYYDSVKNLFAKDEENLLKAFEAELLPIAKRFI